MIKTDPEYDSKSREYNCQWLLEKVKAIVSGLDTKTNKRVSLRGAIFSFLTMQQYHQETNDAYLTQFKSNVENLKLTRGEHILVSNELIDKPMVDISDTDKQKEKEHFEAVAFILRSDENRYKKLLDDLKSSSNRGREEYPTNLTPAFDLLVRESGEYDSVRPRFNTRY